MPGYYAQRWSIPYSIEDVKSLKWRHFGGEIVFDLYLTQLPFNRQRHEDAGVGRCALAKDEPARRIKVKLLPVRDEEIESNYDSTSCQL